MKLIGDGLGTGCLCALINAKSHEPKNLLAVDSIQSRLGLAVFRCRTVEFSD